MAGFDGSAWDEEEEEPSDHQYYNDFPGKEPPLGGVVDMRLRDGASATQTPSHLGATLVSIARGGRGYRFHRLVPLHPFPGPRRVGPLGPAWGGGELPSPWCGQKEGKQLSTELGA